MTSFLGIDPGASGGMARLGPSLLSPSEDAYTLSMTPIPSSLTDILDWIRESTAAWVSNGRRTFALIEKVGGYVAGNPTPGSAMFNFGKGYGALLMALTACGIPFEEITPQKWQKGLGIVGRKKTESKTQFKSRLKGHAQRLFPLKKITLAVADALLIAEYARRTHK